MLGNCFSGGPQGQTGEWNELRAAQENVTLCGPSGRSTNPTVGVQLLFLEASVFNWFGLEILYEVDVSPQAAFLLMVFAVDRAPR